MSLAADTREAVRARPVLYDALRAGIVNYTAAAESLDLDGETEAIATALRRFAESLSVAEADDETAPRESVSVRMESGIERVAVDDLLISAGGVGFRGGDSGAVDNGDGEVGGGAADQPASLTAVRVDGSVSGQLLATALSRLRIAGITVEAAGVATETLVVIVSRRDGVNALRCVESTVS